MGVFEFAAIAVVSMSVASMWKAWTRGRVSQRDEDQERRILQMESRMIELDGLKNEMLLGSRVQVLEELAGREPLPQLSAGQNRNLVNNAYQSS